MDKQDKLHRSILKDLFQSKEWEHLKQELTLGYNNADEALKAVNCDKRELYVGKCRAYKEIMELEKEDWE